MALAKRFVLIVGGLALIAGGCDSNQGNAIAEVLDSSTVEDAPVDAVATTTDGEGGDGKPYPACPDVYSDPPEPDATRTDPGTQGLRALRQQVADSLVEWRAIHEQHGGRYSYTRSFQSYFGGYCTTTVVVDGETVTTRASSSGTRPGPPSQAWTETGAEIGTDNSCRGHSAVTLDELYEQCLTRTLCTDPREHRIYVSFDSNGVLAQCGSFQLNCADDCYVGLEPITLRLGEAASDCCPISQQPDCCMFYGGARTGELCGDACDGMPWPNADWEREIDAYGCPRWVEPEEADGCCGCQSDGG